MSSPRLIAAALSAMALGCSLADPGGAEPGGPGTFPAERRGYVKLAASLRANTTGGLVLPDICATFTLTPYAINNGQLTLAGAPFVVVESAPGEVSFISGCIDSTPSGDDWSFGVSATGWTLCDPTAQLSAGLQSYLLEHGLSMAQFLATFTPQTAVSQLDVNCQAGLDIVAPLQVSVSVPLETEVGYVDLSAQVDAHAVTIGCKDADRDSNDPALLDFGSSLESALPAGSPSFGVVAMAGATPQHQFQSVVQSGQVQTQTWAGQLAFPAAPAQVLQTFIPACDGVFQASQQPTCTTQVAPGQSPEVSTSAGLANAFLSTASSMTWATLAPDGASVTLQTTHAPAQPLSAGTTASSATGASALLAAQTVAAPAGSTFLGVWPSGANPNDLVVLLVDASSQQTWATLSQGATHAWSLSAAQAVSGLTPSQVSCLGLFGAGASGCVPATVSDCGLPTGDQPDLCFNYGLSCTGDECIQLYSGSSGSYIAMLNGLGMSSPFAGIDPFADAGFCHDSTQYTGCFVKRYRHLALTEAAQGVPASAIDPITSYCAHANWGDACTDAWAAQSTPGGPSFTAFASDPAHSTVCPP
ncbi:MAG: hypothetical protein JST92_15540 [Deltaproteobacteria bacterium]|nr:hypothetical protein [Deltaproteobacteria bacterium]